MSRSTVVISPKSLENVAKRLLMEAGSFEKEATIVSSTLVAGNLCGRDSHGVGYLPEYIRTAQAGKLIPNQTLKVEVDAGPVIVCNGNRGYGQVLGLEAINLGISRAKEIGLCAVSLNSCHHLGRIGSFAEECANNGLASIHFTNVAGHHPLVAPYRGASARLGTNPFTASFPAPPGHDPIVLDMATSHVALGKIRNAFQSGEEISRGLVIDSDGNDTNDPSVMFPNVQRGKTTGSSTTKSAPSEIGALLAAAEHKGYGLALMCELYGGIATSGPTVAPHHERPPCIINSMFTIIFDPVKTSGGRPLSKLYKEITMLEEYIKSSPVRSVEDPDNEGHLFPGERAHMNRKENINAIELDAGTWSSILDAASSLGIDEEEINAALSK